MEDSAGKQQQTNKETKNVDSVGKNQQTNKETKHVVMIKKNLFMAEWWLMMYLYSICVFDCFLFIQFLFSCEVDVCL